jgi:hypothetical protein
VTSAQRARLVVALGVLNLVLATLALAVGISTPLQPLPGIAAVPSSTPAAPVSLPPVGTLPPLRTPAPEPPGPSSTPPATPEATPTSEPSAIPIPTGVVIVADRPTPPPDSTEPTAGPTTPAATPDPTAKPAPTNPPHPTPSTKPPPKPTPTPRPAVQAQAHPPCPGSVEGPPGHSKGEPWEKPCGNGKGGGNNGNGNDNTKGGVIIVLPLTLSAAALGGRRRIADTLRRRPSAR